MRNSALAVCLALAMASCGDGPGRVETENAKTGDATAPVVNASREAPPVAFDPELMTVILRGDGITVATPGRRWPVTLDAATQDYVERTFALFGTPERTEGPEDCPAGNLNFLEYPNRLKLAFQDGKFVGYWADESSRGVATPGGIEPGSPRTALGNAPYQQASFGKIVTVDGAFAIIDDAETKVTDIYAGAACIYD